MSTGRKMLFAFALSAAPAFALAGGGGYGPGGDSQRGTESSTRAVDFERVDTDASGHLDQQEAARVADLDFASADIDQDGKLSRSEYESAKQARTRDMGGPQFPQDRSSQGDSTQMSSPQVSSFDALDRDQSGVIDAEELSGVPGMDLSSVDADGDGQISRSEFEASHSSQSEVGPS